MIWWMRFSGLLNHRRLMYAWIAAGVLWLAWLLSVLLGKGNMDLAGQVIGTDYLQFYASGVTLQQGQSARLYDFTYQSQIEQTVAGPGLSSFHANITPPFSAWVFLPLSLLPYQWSFITWSLFGLQFLWLSMKLTYAEKPGMSFLWSMIWFPVFAAISFGQNSLLSLFLLSLTFWLWRKEKLLLAGLAASLLLFKPQMVFGVSILWMLEWRKDWKSLAGLITGGSALAAISFGFMPDASRAYVALARDFLPGLIFADQFPLWHLHSLRGFWALLLPGQVTLVEGLSIILSIGGLIAYILLWREKRSEPDLLFAGAICLTIWITPHAMIYDWSILMIAALLLWKSYPQLRQVWKPVFAVMWVAAFLSGPLTFLQLKYLPVAVQVSIPAYLMVLYTSYRLLMPKADPVTTESI